MRNTVLLMLTGLLLASQAYGRDDKCPTWPAYYVESFCNCGMQLNSLEITVPKGMKVMSACLRDDHDLSSPGRLIDLSKEKVSLDKYKNGNIPYGTIYLRGEIIVNGKVTVDSVPQRFQDGNVFVGQHLFPFGACKSMHLNWGGPAFVDFRHPIVSLVK